MVSPHRILVLGTSYGGGDWPPLAAVTVGLHQAGHAVQCFGDPTIAQAFASTAMAVEVMPPEATLGPFIARWRAAGAEGPSPMRAWADACWPAVRALVRDFRPRLLRWCCINSNYYFGSDSLRPFEADFAQPSQSLLPALRQAIGEADLALHGTDPLFDPPPPSFPRHHHAVGPLMWEPSSVVPPYLDVPGAAVGARDRQLVAPGGGNRSGPDRPADLGRASRPRRGHPHRWTSTRRARRRACQCPD